MMRWIPSLKLPPSKGDCDGPDIMTSKYLRLSVNLLQVNMDMIKEPSWGIALMPITGSAIRRSVSYDRSEIWTMIVGNTLMILLGSDILYLIDCGSQKIQAIDQDIEFWMITKRLLRIWFYYTTNRESVINHFTWKKLYRTMNGIHQQIILFNYIYLIK